MEITINRNEAINNIIRYFEKNKDTFNRAIEELDNWNGYLGDNRYYPMDCLDDFFCDSKPIDLLNRAFFGMDEDSWELNSYGEKVHRHSFNPNREYFTFNGYGNLVSTNYIDYSGRLDSYAIKEMQENRQHINTISEAPELKELFDILESAED